MVTTPLSDCLTSQAFDRSIQSGQLRVVQLIDRKMIDSLLPTERSSWETRSATTTHKRELQNEVWTSKGNTWTRILLSKAETFSIAVVSCCAGCCA